MTEVLDIRARIAELEEIIARHSFRAGLGNPDEMRLVADAREQLAEAQRELNQKEG